MIMDSRRAATIELEADTSQVAFARRFVRGVLADGVGADVLGDLQLIVSELFSNAVEHGDNTTVRVGVTQSDDFAAVSVRSDGSSHGVRPPDDWRVPDPEAITGRGLGIVREIADDVTVERDGDIVTITARCALRTAST